MCNHESFNHEKIKQNKFKFYKKINYSHGTDIWQTGNSPQWATNSGGGSINQRRGDIIF